MDSLRDLLGDYSPKEPAEVLAVKEYINQQFNAPASVAVRGDLLIVTVGSASLANALRLRTPALQAAAGTTNRIVLRIG